MGEIDIYVTNRLPIKVPSKSWIEVMFFARVAGTAEGLKIADVIGSPFGKWNNMIDRQFSLCRMTATAFALRAIPLQHIFSHFRRNSNSP
jgi:hypothetical protein